MSIQHANGLELSGAVYPRPLQRLVQVSRSAAESHSLRSCLPDSQIPAICVSDLAVWRGISPLRHPKPSIQERRITMSQGYCVLLLFGAEVEISV